MSVLYLNLTPILDQVQYYNGQLGSKTMLSAVAMLLINLVPQ